MLLALGAILLDVYEPGFDGMDSRAMRSPSAPRARTVFDGLFVVIGPA